MNAKMLLALCGVVVVSNQLSARHPFSPYSRDREHTVTPLSGKNDYTPVQFSSVKRDTQVIKPRARK